jgi:hypothetical protein
VEDSQQLISYDNLFEISNDLIAKHSLLDKNIEETPVIYILDPVILKYSTKRFIFQTCEQLKQVFTTGTIQGNELFITHNFITKYPEDEELNQEQMRRIVKPIQQMLLMNFPNRQNLETQLQQVIAVLEQQKYPSKNISYLLAFGE